MPLAISPFMLLPNPVTMAQGAYAHLADLVAESVPRFNALQVDAPAFFKGLATKLAPLVSSASLQRFQAHVATALAALPSKASVVDCYKAGVQLLSDAAALSANGMYALWASLYEAVTPRTAAALAQMSVSGYWTVYAAFTIFALVMVIRYGPAAVSKLGRLVWRMGASIMGALVRIVYVRSRTSSKVAKQAVESMSRNLDKNVWTTQDDRALTAMIRSGDDDGAGSRRPFASGVHDLGYMAITNPTGLVKLAKSPAFDRMVSHAQETLDKQAAATARDRMRKAAARTPLPPDGSGTAQRHHEGRKAATNKKTRCAAFDSTRPCGTNAARRRLPGAYTRPELLELAHECGLPTQGTMDSICASLAAASA